ncbi:unnamed protein product [Rotaria sordida]|uniref:Uncharacterized protein n=1 Tax=Rotaria sordida TaxID=392033 RepID=A0A818TUY3_9BILA|nr:unnamed protein product [Rotaria sordida]CAF3684258.1 unnamed protein product [Rotaria sordida]
MFFIRILFYCFLLYSTTDSIQINLHLTDEISNNKSDVAFQYDCLYIFAEIKKESDLHQIISYCLTEWPIKWKIQEPSLNQTFTFVQLSKENITSQQLYHWSAPMDVVERYQLYLDEHLSSMESQLFYNCTLPRFGSLCQYSLDINQPDNSLSLNEIIYDFYQPPYEPTNLTCYIHLECNRGSASMCLDWSEICDGRIDCSNNAMDEENCWELEINECAENEHRCGNGQCISTIFLHNNDKNTFECLDQSDEIYKNRRPVSYRWNGEPTFGNEDVACPSRREYTSTIITSSCMATRKILLVKTIDSDTPKSLSDICWLAFRCIYPITNYFDSACNDLCFGETCKRIMNETCPDLLLMPAGPLVFGHMYVAYEKTPLVIGGMPMLAPHYVCYNDNLCSGFYPNKTLLKFNNITCRRSEDSPFQLENIGRASKLDVYVTSLDRLLNHCNTILYNNSDLCNYSTMYRCMNSSKCISKYRLCDGKNDCDYKDDEHCPIINGTCPTIGSKTLFKCTAEKKCMPLKVIQDGNCDCKDNEYGLCDDEYTTDHYIRKHISFQTICDGFTELIPITIDGHNETDETECEYWQCNNTYTRCDGLWNCFNGADEIDCDSLSLLKCPSYHHICVSPQTYELMCLSIEKANDGNIDCVGATDEPKLCRSKNHQPKYENFYCKNDTIHSCIRSHNLCSSQQQCMYGDDEPICNSTKNKPSLYSICNDIYASIRTDIQNFICQRRSDLYKMRIVHFAVNKLRQSDKQLTIQNQMTRFISIPILRQYDQRCHRGLPLQVWLNNNGNLNTIVCLCPPSFYGNFCQYQNQRVSLTLQFQTFSDSRQTLFALIIALIDDSNERIIHSSQQLTYLYFQHCRVKFNIYLLYSTRPKNSTKNYFIHIDVYEKISFKYRGSLFIPIHFPFLPVHRIALQLNIPRITSTIETCSDKNCNHGRSIKYSNDPKGSSFCQCDREWSGKYCNIPHTCMCSSDSLCIGVLANNRSICVCPLNKWSARCLLQHTICQSGGNRTCLNGGQCVPIDDNMIFNEKFICICPKGFSGKRCEKSDNQIILSFDKDILLPQVILIHFIQVIDNALPQNGSTFKNIPVNQNSVTIRWSRPFHIVFIELFNNNYYLITVQTTYNETMIISKTVHSSDHCKHISEILNETIVNFHLIRRIKYYHLSCEKRSLLLTCFYDNTHFCLCNNFGKHRVANCFEFNPLIKHDCFGQNNCERGAQCLQDKATCPQTSMCVCPKCSYGTRCEFSSNIFDLSLDGILGYHIQPHINIKYQSSVVKFSIVLTTIMFIIGLINGILSLITFINKETQKVGCGLYLLGISIITLLTTIIFALKFSILLITQMTYVTNRSFLNFQCHSIDFLLQICLYMDKWLSACVATERVFNVIRGTSFNKEKSIKMAKYIIIILIIFMIGTTIHNPIHRRLLNDDDNNDEKRIWCIVTYPSSLQSYDTIIHICHFFIPFIINIISAIVIIVMTTRQRRRAENQKSRHPHLLLQQLRHHRHLLIAPILSVFLALPRLIISFVSGCIESTRNPWLYLIGYFVSFIPSMLCLVVFVLPSNLYKKELLASLSKYRKCYKYN